MSLGWTNSADGGPGRRSTLGGGSCTTRLMARSGGTSPGRAGVAFSLPVVVPRQVLECSSSCVSLRWLLDEFLHFLHAQFTLGNMVHYFFLVSYLALLVLCLGVA